MDFGKISEICPEEKDSYEKVFLTFDVDWASDFVLEHCINLVEDAGVKATWFVTHETPLLEKLRKNPLFDVGIHPNFNPLLEGDFCYGRNYCEVLEYYLSIAPEAKAIRSHSLATSSRILIKARELGITHESNLCVPSVAGGGALFPYWNWDKLIRCPYSWEDDVACMYEKKIDLSETLKSEHYLMFCFHPIHIFLNTLSLETYESARGLFSQESKLLKIKNHLKGGAEDVLKEILESVA